MESLNLKKINRYSLINQIIPIIYFFVETRWIMNFIGFCVYTICSVGIITIYFLLGGHVIN